MRAPNWLTARPIAHRGLHDRSAGRVENSLSAALAAVAGRFAIECDVQISADGEAMVFHDFALERLTRAAGPLAARDAAELRRIHLDNGPDTIPTLPDFLAAIGGRVPVIVEIKSLFDGDVRLARRVAAIAGAAPGRVAVKSFDPAVVVAVSAAAPDVPRGIVAQSSYEGPEWDRLSARRRQELAQVLHTDVTSPHFLSWRVGDLPVTPLLRSRRLDHLTLIAWTVRNEADRRRAAEHADQIVFEGFLPEA